MDDSDYLARHAGALPEETRKTLRAILKKQPGHKGGSTRCSHAAVIMERGLKRCASCGKVLVWDLASWTDDPEMTCRK